MTKEELNINIGQKIKEIRNLKQMNQSDLARACNKDRQAIEKIENGKVNPTLYTLYEISKALDTKIEIILKGI